MKAGSILCFAVGALMIGVATLHEMERRAKMQGICAGLALTLIGLTIYRLSGRLDE
jgi:hypothetical protein